MYVHRTDERITPPDSIYRIRPAPWSAGRILCVSNANSRKRLFSLNSRILCPQSPSCFYRMKKEFGMMADSRAMLRDD